MRHARVWWDEDECRGPNRWVVDLLVEDDRPGYWYCIGENSFYTWEEAMTRAWQWVLGKEV